MEFISETEAMSPEGCFEPVCIIDEKHCVVEKTDSYGGLGYALGLRPVGSNILKSVDACEAFDAHADPMHTYTLLSDSGEDLYSYDLSTLADEYGIKRLIDGEATAGIQHIPNYIPV